MQYMLLFYENANAFALRKDPNATEGNLGAWMA